MPRNREISGVFLGENYVFGEGERRVVIGECELPDGDMVTVKGNAEDQQLKAGLTYRFYGHTRRHHRHGEQFCFNSFVEDKPTSPAAVRRYLRRLCGTAAKGSISVAVADALLDAFGTDAIDVLLSRPAEAVAAVGERSPRSGWDVEKAKLAVAILRENEDKRRAKLELIDLFDGRGYPHKTVDRALRKWGNAAAAVIRQNPYSLLCLAGVGFKGADQLYCDLAKAAAKTPDEYQDALGWIERQSQCARYEINTRRDGSTWFADGVAKKAVASTIPNGHAKPDAAILHAISEGMLDHCMRDGREWVGIPEVTRHERAVAEVVNDLLDDGEGVLWPDVVGDLSNHQCAQLTHATSDRIGILSGAPGTGKTYCVATLVRAIVDAYGAESVAIGCPTGKAAVRCQEALSAHEISPEDVSISTIHRLLIVQSDGESSGGWSFHHCETSPLPHQFVIVDESSMLDIALTSALFRALPANAHVLLVGDAGQLPPVGPGKPFLDLQQCVPTGELTEILRNSGRIVRACADIRDSRRFLPSPDVTLSDPAENLLFAEARNPDVQSERVLQCIDWLAAESAEQIDTTWDVQVVCPINQNSPVSRRALNELLQQSLNPQGQRIKGNPFRLNDKIVCLKNGFYDAADDSGASQHFVANGELAEVVDLQVGRMCVSLRNPDRVIIVPHRVQDEDHDGSDDKGMLGDWDLGYALSCHKSQGSQWRFVIVVIDSSGAARQVQTRNWLYTAISRASEYTICIGERRVADAMVRIDGIVGRKTFLVEEIRRDMVSRGASAEELFARA